MKNWFIPTVRLPATIKPKLINTAADLLQDIFIRRRCQVIEGGAVTVWWEVEQNKLSPTGPIIDAERREGVMFYTWSEKVTESLASFSIVTFYIVVVLGIGSVIRDVIKVGSEQIFIKDMPKPDSLMLICEGILISRLENNLEREEQLYFILIDIMRSPEIIKMITSSSLKKKENQAIENGNEQ
uniref:Piezo non-specific cation channel cap domain-containing protein n=1 Tax=Euplotes crassus TaxID=5936 RepID=A0A7S3KJ93_EUPCR|mmetsp:Transcript_30670/g.30186  ORF Transcript_30670/g.30186 Transcript_30670/m.30186 type:complete len:184 (+) Transcript_30670:196-747(+)